MSRLFHYKKDYYGGALMMLIGLTAVYGGTRYRIGTLAHMGPGYFPTSVGALLAAMGFTIALGAPRANNEVRAHPSFDLRAWGCIVGGALAFLALGDHGGLVPATFALVFLSALGDKENTIKQAFFLAAGMVVIAVIVFWWALQLELPLFQWS